MSSCVDPYGSNKLFLPCHTTLRKFITVSFTFQQQYYSCSYINNNSLYLLRMVPHVIKNCVLLWKIPHIIITITIQSPQKFRTVLSCVTGCTAIPFEITSHSREHLTKPSVGAPTPQKHFFLWGKKVELIPLLMSQLSHQRRPEQGQNNNYNESRTKSIVSLHIMRRI